MISLTIPGHGKIKLKDVVMDYNGTMAVDGNLFKGLEITLLQLAEHMDLHVITADTFGKVKSELDRVNLSDRIKLSIMSANDQNRGKLEYINQLNPESAVCIGNGRNDELMLKNAGLGIVLVQEEGTHIKTLLAADIVCPDIFAALGLLLNTKRLTATLRS